jgi:hypothetical protein
MLYILEFLISNLGMEIGHLCLRVFVTFRIFLRAITGFYLELLRNCLIPPAGRSANLSFVMRAALNEL